MQCLVLVMGGGEIHWSKMLCKQSAHSGKKPFKTVDTFLNGSNIYILLIFYQIYNLVLIK